VPDIIDKRRVEVYKKLKYVINTQKGLALALLGSWAVRLISSS
jgi:hypothetical protein